MPNLIPITPQLTALYKQVRLRALEDTPTAFGSTYTRESQLTDEDWRQRSLSLDGTHKIGFIALEENEPCGLVACFRDAADPTQAKVISMWVAPSHRGTGLAWSLLDAVHQWAASLGVTTLRLMVTSRNLRAIAFYQRYGFAPTGRTNPYPNDPTLHEIEMTRPLTATTEPPLPSH
jgi:ribosomal protein S18 acetylase RimI-like enzyme